MTSSSSAPAEATTAGDSSASATQQNSATPPPAPPQEKEEEEEKEKEEEEEDRKGRRKKKDAEEKEEEEEDKEKVAQQTLPEGKRRTKEQPEEYLNGQWDAEPFYYTTAHPSSTNGAAGEAPGRSQKRGVIYKRRESMEYECFQAHDGTIYRSGDQVFVEISREEPWMIGAIQSFKMKKRDQLLVKLLRYYRPQDVPEVSFSLIVQERIEAGNFHSTRKSHVRELFSSESALLFHISALRGKCSVKLVKDLRCALAEVDLADPDSFFHCLNFNQESGRLALVQMSIRVGSAYQADVPSCSGASISDDPDRDELLYRPGYLCAETEQNYVKMARTFRTFSLMNNKRITLLEKSARTGDLLFDDAITTLHRCKYNIRDGILEMEGNDKHLTSDSSFLSAEDLKKFGKGIKTYGKNFNKINKELLPHHRREQLVSFYYLWKKSRDATRPKPLSTAKRNQQTVVNGAGGASARRAKNGIGLSAALNAASAAAAEAQGNNGAGAGGGATVDAANNGTESLLAAPLDDLMDYASASETETEHLESAGKAGAGRACHHCFSSKSRDWHHAGHDRLLMCTDCRLFYKKYGQLRPVDRPCTVPPCLLSSNRQQSPTAQNSTNEDDENEEPQQNFGRIRTRGAGRTRLSAAEQLLQREQRPRRTPSSLDGDRLRTPQKTPIGEESGSDRRSTPLRNAVTKSRKRTNRESAANEAETTATTPSSASKAKRAKKGSPVAAGTATPAASRTPSPPQQEKKAEAGEQQAERELLRRPEASENGETTPPPPATTKGAAETKDESPANTSEGSSPSDGSPSALATPKQKEAVLVKKEEAEESQESPTNIGGNTAKSQTKTGQVAPMVRKPIAKVEPLDTTKKEEAEEPETEQNRTENDQNYEVTDEDQCFGGSAEIEEGAGQDQGPPGVPDRTEVYRKAGEGRKVVVVLERRVKRHNGLSCARTDIAFVEVPERQRWREERRNREAAERAARKAAETELKQQQKQQQLNSGQRPQMQLQAGVGGMAKKMEMPAEFVATNGVVGTSAAGPPPTPLSVGTNPASMTMMNGLFVPHPSLVPGAGGAVPAHHPSGSGTINGPFAAQQHPVPASSVTALQPHHPPHPPQPSGMAPSVAHALQLQQQQQQEQQAALVAAMQMAAAGGANPQQLQAMLMGFAGLPPQAPPPPQGAQPPAVSAAQQYHQQLQQMITHLAMQDQQQQQKMMELQRQQQQQKRSTAGQGHHHPLNGQHPHPHQGGPTPAGQHPQHAQHGQTQHMPNGIGTHQHHPQHHNHHQQQKQQQQHQQKEQHPTNNHGQSSATPQQLALMNQLMGLQHQQAAMYAFHQQQQHRPPGPLAPPHLLKTPSAQPPGPPQHPLVAQQQAQAASGANAMMLLELATATMNPQQLIALMSGNGLDPRALEELRGLLLNQQHQQLTAAAAAQQQQQQQAAQAAQQQQQLLAMLASSGFSQEQLHQMVAMTHQQAQQNVPSVSMPSSSSSSSSVAQQQQLQQMVTLAAMQQQQQQQQAVQQQQQQFAQHLEMVRRLQQQTQQEQQQQHR